jgi:hypothetical protein
MEILPLQKLSIYTYAKKPGVSGVLPRMAGFTCGKYSSKSNDIRRVV